MSQYRFCFVPEPNKSRVRTYKSLETMRRSAVRLLGTDTPRFDGDYFIGVGGVCLVPCHPIKPLELFPEKPPA